MPGISTAMREIQRVVKTLQKEAAKHGAETADVEVGYHAPHALWVHEAHNMVLKGQPRPSGRGFYWGPSGRSNFLLGPARSLSNIWAGSIKASLRSGRTLAQALLKAGDLLLKESKKLVPVEYGELKNSGFVKLLHVSEEVD